MSASGRLARAAVTGAALAGCAACTLPSAEPEQDRPEAAAVSSSTPSGSSTPAPSPSGTRSGTSPGSAWVGVADQVEPSVVSIGVQSSAGGGEGSGVVLDTEGHVLTNNHVVASARAGGDIEVTLSDGRVFASDLVGADPATDLAVLQMQDAPGDLTALPFQDSESVEVGAPVMAVGNPLGLSHTVTLGIVSALDRPVTTAAEDSTAAGDQVVTNAIQTDAAVNPGNSGGALVDDQGRLIGINSSIATLGASAGGQGGSIGLGFAIPSNQARWVAQELIDRGSVRHAYLGVTPVDAVVEIGGVRREAAGLREVITGTAAAGAGLRAGEAVAAVDGEPVAGALSLVAQIRERQPGTQVTLTVADRDGSSREVPVEFGTRPES
ncbi:MAG TPA: trypsin-like peptidase domain-containing protein [Nocardioidaceae bacterium]|nr:trypsin-like peptidase domain-containing protein [Nocardioidaceae bacterium]